MTARAYDIHLRAYDEHSICPWCGALVEAASGRDGPHVVWREPRRNKRMEEQI